LRTATELAVDALSADLQGSRRQHGVFPIAQHEVNALLDQCFLQRVVLRLLLDQHAALIADSNVNESSTTGDVASAPIVDWVPVVPLIQDTVEQVKAFSIEKNGALGRLVFALCAAIGLNVIYLYENAMPQVHVLTFKSSWQIKTRQSRQTASLVSARHRTFISWYETCSNMLDSRQKLQFHHIN
jgi:hypothetical protein